MYCLVFVSLMDIIVLTTIKNWLQKRLEKYKNYISIYVLPKNHISIKLKQFWQVKMYMINLGPMTKNKFYNKVQISNVIKCYFRKYYSNKTKQ